MDLIAKTLSSGDYPPLLREIPNPPKTLWYQGALPPADLKLLAVVGSRRFTSYGQAVVSDLIAGLRGYPVGIVSGLAIGIDTLAHEAALKANLYTLAIPGSGLKPEVLYPRRNRALAKRIVEAGGGLLSEFPLDTPAAPWTFPQRNRLMAGIAPATLLIEASERSGTLITARLAVDYNRELLVVPGNIFADNSRGAHQFLKLGATPTTSSQDILLALDLDPESRTGPALKDLTPEEKQVLACLNEPLPADEIAQRSGLTIAATNVLLMHLELKGLVAETNRLYRAVV